MHPLLYLIYIICKESFEWGFKLANWNTGRLYAFPDVPQIFPVGRGTDKNLN